MDSVVLNKWVVSQLPQGRWLVGVSGGGDSVALLRMLVDAGLSERLVVGNFEHGWGREESGIGNQEEGRFGKVSADFVRELCERLGVAFRLGEGGGKAATNAEAVARDERYAWFKQVCVEDGLEGVLVGHTQDDVIETFLMRLGKGSGLQGLAGMSVDRILPVAGGDLRVMRPVLHTEREALRGYLRGLHQAWMEDPDNEMGGSQRARVRKLIPLLEEAGITMRGVGASISALTSADRTLDGVVDGWMRMVVWHDAGASAEVEQAQLQRVVPEIGVRILGRIMARLVPEMGVVRRSKRINLLARLVQEDAGHATLGGLKFSWKAGGIVVKREKEPVTKEPKEMGSYDDV